MASRKKLLTSAIALGTAAALTLGGTFAWQSISQTALNEASDIVNPGGRLHNDISYVNSRLTDCNIYVENFTDPTAHGDTIFARVRLEEYMELVMNYGVEGVERVETIAGAKNPKQGADVKATDATRKDQFDYAYAVHYFGLDEDEQEAGTENNKSYTYWTLNAGDEDSEALYMPTFNKNKDSVAADLNGTYDVAVGGISSRRDEQYSYNNWAEYEDEDGTIGLGAKKDGATIYDADSDKDDELSSLSDAALNEVYEMGDRIQNNIVQAALSNKDIALVDEIHKVSAVNDSKGLISMSAWLEMLGDGEYDEDTHGGYWVYDDSENGDGWVYWSSPIEAGETTGLLLDSISLNHVMSDTWYYAINVVGQFVTANDLGNSDESKGALTGFYMDGETVSENAEKLLKAIGVEFGEGDTTAPTFVSAEHPAGDNNSQAWDMTISNLNDGDFPLTLKGYYLDGENDQISGEPYFTSQITVEEGVVSTSIDCEHQYQVTFDGANQANSAYDADTGTLTIQYHWTTGTESSYATLTVTDASGNTGSLPGSIWVVAGRGCFTAGTQVSGPDGLVNIEDIEEGDQVYSLDLASGKKTAVTVLKVHDQWVNDEFYHITVGSATITATPEHLFYVNGEWVEARDLSVGDALVSLNGAEDTTITAIAYEKLDAPITVYNLTVDGDHNFLITGDELVVHNVSK